MWFRKTLRFTVIFLLDHNFKRCTSHSLITVVSPQKIFTPEELDEVGFSEPQKFSLETGEVVWQVKCLLCKSEGWRLDPKLPSTHVKAS